MINEINHREPRGFTNAGTIGPLPICGSKTGCHCTSKRLRRSDLEQLGIGVNLYFKMLKYFGCIFFLFFLLSIPSMLIYYSGSNFKDHTIPIQKWLALESLGNLQPQKEVVAFSVDSSPSYNAATYMPITCPRGKIVELMSFGLALKNYTAVGYGLNVTVKTVDRCSLGSMTNLTKEDILEKEFYKTCKDKNQCELLLDFNEIFDIGCRDELRNRAAGNTFYGPSRLYATVLCEDKDIKVNDDWILTRDKASKIVVWIDLVILFLFIFAIFRLKFYQQLSINDFKNGSLRIDDFSVILNNIPISRSDYNDNPEILKAMLMIHLEDILQNET